MSRIAICLSVALVAFVLGGCLGDRSRGSHMYHLPIAEHGDLQWTVPNRRERIARRRD